MNERSEFIMVHEPCPCGDSSDAFAIRENGSGLCFSCNKNFSTKELLETNMDSIEYEYKIIGLRGISRKTFEIYGVQTKLLGDTPIEVAFPYYGPEDPETGEIIECYKVREVDSKNMRWVGQGVKDTRLFGQDIFDPGSKKSITITEGEFDAMAAYEMLRGQSACVSIRNGAGGALADFKKHYDYINSFERIYICFDNDKPGEAAVKSIQGLFDFRKVYHVKFHKFKDANDYIQNDSADDFEATWKSAKRFAPDNIISGFDQIEEALSEQNEDQLGTYPFPDLNEMLYGIHAGEVIVIKAGEGVGKTEFFRATEHHLIKTTEYPIGIIHLEEDNGTTIKAIAGYELGVPAVLPDCGLSREDILSGYKRAVKDDEGRVHIHSSFDVEDEEAFLGNIRFLVSAVGCRFIFLDHISWLATGLQDEDERKKLDRISQKLKLLAKELRFALIMISHINDDGKTRGSRNITKVANSVIHLERDLREGSTGTQVIVEKARLGGRTGPAGKTFFDRESGRLLPDAFVNVSEPIQPKKKILVDNWTKPATIKE